MHVNARIYSDRSLAMHNFSSRWLVLVAIRILRLICSAISLHFSSRVLATDHSRYTTPCNTKQELLAAVRIQQHGNLRHANAKPNDTTIISKPKMQDQRINPSSILQIQRGAVNILLASLFADGTKFTVGQSIIPHYIYYIWIEIFEITFLLILVGPRSHQNPHPQTDQLHSQPPFLSTLHTPADEKINLFHFWYG